MVNQQIILKLQMQFKRIQQLLRSKRDISIGLGKNTVTNCSVYIELDNDRHLLARMVKFYIAKTHWENLVIFIQIRQLQI